MAAFAAEAQAQSRAAVDNNRAGTWTWQGKRCAQLGAILLEVCIPACSPLVAWRRASRAWLVGAPVSRCSFLELALHSVPRGAQGR